MNRIVIASLALLAGATIAACGTPTAASSAGAKASPSPGANRGRNGAAGELVQMNGTTLILSGQAGDVTVVYNSSTTFQKTSTGAFADIKAGNCVLIAGPKDAAGNITPATVVLGDMVGGACAARPGGGFGGPPDNQGTPAPRPSARPNNNNFGFVAGQVVSVSGTTVQVKDSAGNVQSLSVPTTVRVTRTAAASSSDLALHQCLQAQGRRDTTSGQVTARAITIVPPGPSGCFTGAGGFGGFGRFGGGGRPGGAGGGGGGGGIGAGGGAGD